jgi:hypothetical protein
MPPISEKKLLTTNEVVKLIGFVVIVGSAWLRMEYKFNESISASINILEKHIIADKYEKEEIKKETAQLRKEFEDYKLIVERLIEKEFLRPEDVQVRRKK